MSLASAPKFRPDLPGGNTAPYCLQRSWSVEKYFDEEGLFYEEAFMSEVRDFFAAYEQLAIAGGGGKKEQ